MVGDRKTPASAAALAAEISARGLETVYFSIEDQDQWGRQFPLYPLIPYNTDGRRIFGYLRALEDGCELLISMDDDNFPTEDDFVGFHRRTGQGWRLPVVKEEKQFHNICEYLTFDPPRLVYPRGGFPSSFAAMPIRLSKWRMPCSFGRRQSGLRRADCVAG